ncbi:hypothetical protein DB88DRAFT_481789 [Papiliotrema laurentii]|uniref:Steroid 5-alpha reductase C-terminal domain-containing protein n=1 Tax=Papiliotrema laurentii TaxID=5418 RepID=A0AAD9FUB1_PAPLA|nr:hypothetical protein DB88DRAFT_481789 [Papiliotrema laurentii]
MSPIQIIDKYNLVITFLVTLGWQMLGFAIAWTFKFDKVTDFTGGSNFFILAMITFFANHTYYTRNAVVSALFMAWAARLALFLLFRVLKTGSDTRFDDIRSHFFKFAGFWAGQILWVFTVSLPVVILNSPAVTDPSKGGGYASWGQATDIVGVILFGIGFLWEAIGDVQKYRYKASNPPKGKPCTKGLWYFSRHPPYFGEIVLHWGIWLMCISPAIAGGLTRASRDALYGSVVAPIFTMLLLLFLSGMPTAEKPTAKKYFLQSHDPDETATFSGSQPKNDTWDKYKDYLNKTSILIPIPPAVYRPLPDWLKHTLLMDWRIYRFDEAKDGQAALDEARKKRDHEV